MIEIKNISEEYYKHNYILCCNKNNEIVALYGLETILEEYNEYGQEQLCIYANDNKFKKEYSDFYNLVYYQKLDDYIWYSICEEELIEKGILIPEQWNYENIGKLIINKEF